MTSGSQLRHRHSIRLKEYDYGQVGAYFVTIVVHGREILFGRIITGEMNLSQFGDVARVEWFKTMELRPNVKLWADEFVVMPNHIHGIIWINENDPVGAERRSAPTKPLRVIAGSLGAIVRAYKSAVTYKINEIRSTRGAPIWQRNYYEHIIRNESDYERIYKYIQSNPFQWERDEENPFQ
jgi:putative transposase